MKPPKLFVGEQITINTTHVCHVKSYPDHPGTPAVRLEPDGKALPADAKRGYVVFIDGGRPTEGDFVATVTIAKTTWARVSVDGALCSPQQSASREKGAGAN